MRYLTRLGGLGIFVSGAVICFRLGNWQKRRKAMKEAYLSSYDAQQSLPALEIQDLASAPGSPELAFRRIKVEGSWLLASGCCLVGPKPSESIQGDHEYAEVCPLVLENGIDVVWVDRGMIPVSEGAKSTLELLQKKEDWINEEEEALKVLRMNGKKAKVQGFGTSVKNNQATKGSYRQFDGSWVRNDLEDFRDFALRGMPDGHDFRFADFVLSATDDSSSKGLVYPRKSATLGSIKNMHATPEVHEWYARTWYSLSFISSVFAILWWRKTRQFPKSLSNSIITK